MKLNCDLGESFGAWTMPVDDEIMSIIDQANVACGFHAGDPLVMKQALTLAKQHGVEIGAHPSYPDLQGFGRRSLAMASDELVACVQYQVSALLGMAEVVGAQVTYVKPHGALYNDMMQNTSILRSVMEAVSGVSKNVPLALMIQATPDNFSRQTVADEFGVRLRFEAFADRQYTDDGFLKSRQLPGAVLSEQEALNQAKQLLSEGRVTSVSNRSLSLNADSLCVHGDTPGAVAIARQIKALQVKQSG